MATEHRPDLHQAIDNARTACNFGIKTAEELQVNTSGWWERLRHLETLDRMLYESDHWRANFTAMSTVLDEMVAASLRDIGILPPPT